MQFQHQRPRSQRRNRDTSKQQNVVSEDNSATVPVWSRDPIGNQDYNKGKSNDHDRWQWEEDPLFHGSDYDACLQNECTDRHPSSFRFNTYPDQGGGRVFTLAELFPDGGLRSICRIALRRIPLYIKTKTLPWNEINYQQQEQSATWKQACDDYETMQLQVAGANATVYGYKEKRHRTQTGLNRAEVNYTLRQNQAARQAEKNLRTQWRDVEKNAPFVRYDLFFTTDRDAVHDDRLEGQELYTSQWKCHQWLGKKSREQGGIHDVFNHLTTLLQNTEIPTDKAHKLAYKMYQKLDPRNVTQWGE